MAFCIISVSFWRGKEYDVTSGLGKIISFWTSSRTQILKTAESIFPGMHRCTLVFKNIVWKIPRNDLNCSFIFSLPNKKREAKRRKRQRTSSSGFSVLKLKLIGWNIFILTGDYVIQSAYRSSSCLRKAPGDWTQMRRKNIHVVIMMDGSHNLPPQRRETFRLLRILERNCGGEYYSLSFFPQSGVKHHDVFVAKHSYINFTDRFDFISFRLLKSGWSKPLIRTFRWPGGVLLIISWSCGSSPVARMSMSCWQYLVHAFTVNICFSGVESHEVFLSFLPLIYRCWWGRRVNSF